MLAIATSLLVVLSGLFVAPAVANAAEGQAASNVSIDWGFYGDWRWYADAFGGEASFGGGASASPAPYNWGTAGTGVFDPATQTGSIGTGGSVRWSGWHGIDVTLSSPTIVLTSATTGELRADYNRGMAGSGSPTGAQVVIATLDLSAATISVADGSASFSGVQVTGAAVLDDIFTQYAGQRLDDLSFSFTYEVPSVAVATSTTLEASASSVEAGTAVTFTAQVTPAAAGTVTFSAGGAVLGTADTDTSGAAAFPTSTLAAGTHVVTASFAPDDSAAFLGSDSNEQTVTVTEAAQVFEPAIQVFEADGVTPLDASKAVYDGDQIVIKGTGFDPAANVGGRGAPIPNTLPQGSYVVFGSFLEAWQPSASAPSSARKAGPQKWVLAESVLDQVPAQFQQTIRNQWAPLAADGSWSATLTLAPISGALENGRYGIYTYGAGGVTNADQELEFLVNYQGERPAEPEWDGAIEVFLADGVTPYTDQEVHEGDQLVVKGTGFDPEANTGALSASPIPSALPQGTFVVFGSFADQWQPSTGAGSTTRVMHSESREWAITDAVFEQIPEPNKSVIAPQRVVLETDGTFTATVTVKAPANPLAEGNWGIYSYAGGVGPKNADQERSVAINFQGADTEGPEEPETPATGGLVWSFKASWNFYLNNIANGTTTVSNGATQGSNGEIGYTQVTGGDYDAETGLGTIRYQGTVRYVSAAHGFDIALSDPWVVLDENGATITANVSRTDTSGVSDLVRIPLAELDAGAPADVDGLLTWESVAGVFSDAIQPEGWQDYAGLAIDPVTFTYGSDDEPVEEGPSVSVSSLTVKQGGQVTFTGEGFEPGTQVTATVHSEPVVLGTVAADANGAVSFDWTVPADFEAAEHTIELAWGNGQSVSTTFLVEKATSTGGGTGGTDTGSATGDICVARAVTGGSLTWGLKESFRSYVQGSIAKGSFSGGTFTASGGAFNVVDGGVGRANFSGAITATGHGGLLNFQLSSPSVQITGPGTGVLFAHVSSTSTSGAAAVNGVVAFANLSFGGPAISGDTLSVSGASATLTAAGAQAFAGFYQAGAALDPVSFSVSLGGEVPCDSTTDPVVLAQTGSSGDTGIALISIAALAVLLGLGAMRLRRRHEVA